MLAARHRARLAMEDGSRDNHEETTKGRGARRRLFVDDDDDSSENNGEIKENQVGKLDNDTNRFMEERRNDMDNAKKRWNFDFEKEEPLPGRYEWVKVNDNFSEDNSNDNILMDNNISRDNTNKFNEDEENEEVKKIDANLSLED